MSRYDVVSIREYEHNGETKKNYTKLGVAFPFKDKDGYTVRLDAIPAPQDGTFTFLLFPPKPREDQPSGGQGGPAGDLDDSIPFSMEWRV